MKMVKSLLLGSAAGVIAVAGAQAADLPVKAKPVEYVKICSLYGDGFYYIPGTDTCIKFAGVVWAEVSWGYTGGGENPAWSGVAGAHDRSSSLFNTRARTDFDMDARTQTAFGTLRTFGRIRGEVTSGQGTPVGPAFSAANLSTNAITGGGVNTTNEGGIALQVPRAFLQFAGFTFGRVKSYTDGVAACSDFRLLQSCQTASDTTGGGNNEISYTAELGNGITFSLGAAERRVNPITNLSYPGPVNTVPELIIGTQPLGMNAGVSMPQPFLNLRVNQAWGSASVSVVANNNQATYYQINPALAGCVQQAPGNNGAPAANNGNINAGTTACGHPDDKWGGAVGVSAMFNVPFISPGDRVGGYFQYGVGALKYGAGQNVVTPGLFGSNNNVALGFVTDAVYTNPGGGLSQLQLTTGWTIGGAFEHWFTPSVSFTLYGTYAEVNYNNAVINSGAFCTGANNQLFPAAGVGNNNNSSNAKNLNFAANARCDPSFHFWQVLGSASWYPIKSFRFAFEVAYSQVDTGFAGQVFQVLYRQPGLRALGPNVNYTASDQGIVSAIFRAHRTWGNDIGG